MGKEEFKSGQIITHKLFNYRGVSLEVDQTCSTPQDLQP